MHSILSDFMINEEEYSDLDKHYGQLVEYAAWQLIRKNSRNNHTDEQIDVSQELKIALIKAGAYYKRQTYIESCLEVLKLYVKDTFLQHILAELQDLWLNKTRHGASRQKFGPHQERILYKLIKTLVPPNERPKKNAILKIDSKFATYCKAITWNTLKALGKRITREKSVRYGLVSLSEFDHLG